MPTFRGTCKACGQEFKAYRSQGVLRKQGEPQYCSRVCFMSAWEKSRSYICEQCGKEFLARTTAVRKNPRFCSTDCYKASGYGKTLVVCQQCGKVWETFKAYNRKYCSKTCMGRNSTIVKQKKAISSPRLCLHCGKLLSGRQRRNLFCGKECLQNWTERHEKGEHAILKRNDPNYRGPNWKQQRRNARHRDNYACQRCGAIERDLGCQLDVHHIRPFSKFGLDDYRSANALSNLVSLCRPCHIHVENVGWAWE